MFLNLSEPQSAPLSSVDEAGRASLMGLALAVSTQVVSRLRNRLPRLLRARAGAQLSGALVPTFSVLERLGCTGACCGIVSEGAVGLERRWSRAGTTVRPSLPPRMVPGALFPDVDRKSP